MKRVAYILIWLVAIALAWPMVKPLVRQDQSGATVLGKMTVQEGGRVKPLDSVARQTLLVFRGKQSVRVDGDKVPAIEWMLDVLFNHESANKMPIFRIDHPDILGMFGLEAGTKKYFSYNDLMPYLSRIQQQARQINPDNKQRNSYEQAINRLFGTLIQYQMILQTVQPLQPMESTSQYYNVVASGILDAAAKFAGSGEDSPEKFSTPQLQMQMRQLNSMSESPLFLLHYNGEWKTPGSVMIEGIPAETQLPQQMALLGELADARKNGDQEAFDAAALQLAQFVPEVHGEHPKLEYYFNQAQPFIVALIIYVFVMLLVFFGWLFKAQILLRPAYHILLVGFAIHTIGLILRVIITGYAPVTNLYSSAVGVGWVAVLLSLAFEYLQKKGVGSLAAAIIGFLTLLVAHHLSDSGDTMEKMRAVLNSNFWLSTHVITITMGYGATFLAGFLGIIYTLYGWFSRDLTKDMQKSFHRMVYGATAFALLFSFVGTVLGGIWADQSWGRFWGWDPKENGALMIVLWTALMLHALRGGIIKTRGLVNLAIVGNVITAWSWFGTNMLGVGLHSYGFMDSAFFWLLMFVFSQFAIIFLEALFPVRVKKA